MKIRWIGQSGYILSDKNTTIVIDPYLSDAVNRIAGRERMIKAPFKAEELKCDAVICTHNHLDHVDIDAIPLMNKENMLFLAPIDAKSQLIECGVTKFMEFDEGATYAKDDFKFTAVFAEHTVPAIGLIVEHSGKKLYFSGDTIYNEKLESLKDYNIDFMFICINGKLGNMNVDEAIRLTNIINPKVAVPSHYGMFESNTENPEKFTVKQRFIMEYNREYDLSELEVFVNV